MRGIIIVFLLFIFHGRSTFAIERFEFYNGVRSLGMGGASVAIVNDETALLSNPAALGKLRNYFVTIADPELDVSESAERVVGSEYTAFLDPEETRALVVDSPNNRLHQRAQLFPSFVVTNFGFGIFAKYSTDAYLVDDGTPGDYYNLYYRNDFAAVMGLNLRIWDGIIKIGVNARAVNRVEIERDDLDETVTTHTLDNLASEGFGIGTDVGLILTAPVMWLPSIAVVYRDVGTTSYSMGEGYTLNVDTRPNRTQATLDAGFSITPLIGKKSRMVITGEVVDLMGVTEETDPDPLDATVIEDDISRRIHYGIEFNIADIFFIRGGMNQGYWTAGLELASDFFQMQFAAYGEEVGTVDDPVEDRRYVGKLSWRF